MTVAFLRVRSGQRRYGLPLEHLTEVLDSEKVFPVPAAEPALRGLMRVRDRLLPLVHLGAFVDGDPLPSEPGEVAVLVRAEGRALCLEVDEAETVTSAHLMPARTDSRVAWAAGLVRDETGLIALLDVPGLVARLIDTESVK